MYEVSNLLLFSYCYKELECREVVHALLLLLSKLRYDEVLIPSAPFLCSNTLQLGCLLTRLITITAATMIPDSEADEKS